VVIDLVIQRDGRWDSSPSSSARRTAARRLFTPSFEKMLLVCVRIVFNETIS
jgi:hypothetical protein